MKRVWVFISQYTAIYLSQSVSLNLSFLKQQGQLAVRVSLPPFDAFRGPLGRTLSKPTPIQVVARRSALLLQVEHYRRLCS